MHGDCRGLSAVKRPLLRAIALEQLGTERLDFERQAARGLARFVCERAEQAQRSGVDREVEQELQTVRPGSDAPSRAGITPDGSGADGERG